MGWISNSPGLHSWKTCVCAQSLTCVQLFVTPWTADHRPTVGSFVHGVSPSKNTRMGCHALLQRIFPTQGSNPSLFCLLHWQVGALPLECCAVLSHSVMSDSATPWTAVHQPPLVHGDSPGKNIGVGCLFLLQGIFPTQGSNPSLPPCRQML